MISKFRAIINTLIIKNAGCKVSASFEQRCSNVKVVKNHEIVNDLTILQVHITIKTHQQLLKKTINLSEYRFQILSGQHGHSRFSPINSIIKKLTI